MSPTRYTQATRFVNAFCHTNQRLVVPRSSMFQSLERHVSQRCYSHKVPGEKEEEEAVATEPLGWNNFEFGALPKQDERFSKDSHHIIQHADDASFGSIIEEESRRDHRQSKALRSHVEAWDRLDDSTVVAATTILKEYVTEDRLRRLEQVLSKRTGNLRLLFENPSNPSNVWACLRTADSFGLQHADLVIDPSAYTGKAAIASKKGTRTAMGSAKWMTLRSHPRTVDALEEMRANGYSVYAADGGSGSVDLRSLTFPKDQKCCIVLGNEERGISEDVRTMVDATFYLPMNGFAESYNLSVATAITLAHLSSLPSPIRPGDLTPHEKDRLRLKWILQSLAQKRMGYALLRQNNIELPEI